MYDFTLDGAGPFIFNESYNELCMSIDALQQYRESTELFLEGLNDPQLNRKGQANVIAKNTKDIAGKANKAVGAVVDAKASIYNAVVVTILNIFNAVLKIIKYLAEHVADMILGINRLAGNISRIPSSMVAKIHGDIELYINVSDIQAIYNMSIINKIDSFISYLELLTKGNTWGTLFHKNKVTVDGIQMSNNDLNTCKKMHALATQLENISFNKAIIKMSDDNTKRAYFSTDESINFTDLHGKSHHTNYYGALSQLLTDLSSNKDRIKNLEKAFGEKINRTELNQSWAMLGINHQNTIQQALQDTGRVISVIGNICKCITADMKTIDGVTKKILSASNNEKK